MIVLRLARGITVHFGMRLTEWVMMLPMFGWFIALSNADGMFDQSTAFSTLHQYAGEKTWALVCLSVFLIRMASLVINGTFRTFTHSPHLRGLTAIVAGWFWALVTFGAFTSMLAGTSLGTDFFAYATFTVFEVVNVFRASADVGATGRQNERIESDARTHDRNRDEHRNGNRGSHHRGDLVPGHAVGKKESHSG